MPNTYTHIARTHMHFMSCMFVELNQFVFVLVYQVCVYDLPTVNREFECVVYVNVWLLRLCVCRFGLCVWSIHAHTVVEHSARVCVLNEYRGKTSLRYATISSVSCSTVTSLVRSIGLTSSFIQYFCGVFFALSQKSSIIQKRQIQDEKTTWGTRTIKNRFTLKLMYTTHIHTHVCWHTRANSGELTAIIITSRIQFFVVVPWASDISCIIFLLVRCCCS